MAEVSRVVDHVAMSLGYVSKDEQRAVITSFVQGNDVMAILPTGFGKSLCYTSLSMIFDELRSDNIKIIIIVITPITAIIKDQVRLVKRSSVVIKIIIGSNFTNEGTACWMCVWS